jgi:thymidine kinase
VAKLYFRYGAMGSAKTLNLLAVRHNYELQGKKVILLKPRSDDRFGTQLVRSRAGLSYEADLLLDDDTVFQAEMFEGLHCVLVDEGQFLSPAAVDALRQVTYEFDVPVIAYGLRTDFATKLFPGSRRLIELADAIEEVKTTCMFCNRKAIFNLRHDSSGRAIVDGPQVMLGADAQYSPVCHGCYVQRTGSPVGEGLRKTVARNPS